MPKTRAPKASRFQNNKTAVRPTPGVPDRDTLLKFIRDSGETDKAAIAKAFALKGEDRRALRLLLQTLETEGALGRRGRRGFAAAGALPEVGVVDVIERDPDGDLMVRLTKGEDAPPACRCRRAATPRPAPRLGLVTACSCGSSNWRVAGMRRG